MSLFQRTLVILSVGGLLASLYFYVSTYRIQHISEISDNVEQPMESQSETNEQVIARVATMIVVPSGETPTIATLDDLTQVKDQVFFSKAETGDKIIVYLGAKKAILYRPSTKQIIEVGPLEVREGIPRGTEKE